MAYDEGLAERLRLILDEHRGVSEKKMFGGLCFSRPSSSGTTCRSPLRQEKR